MELSATARSAARQSGKDGRRARRARRQQAGRAELRLARHRLGRPPARRDVQGAHAYADGARALSRRRARGGRSFGRPRRFLFRLLFLAAAVPAGGQRAGDRGHLAAAAPGAARCAHHARSRVRGHRDRHLVRTACSRGDAGRGDRQAQRGLRQGGARSGGAEADRGAGRGAAHQHARRICSVHCGGNHQRRQDRARTRGKGGVSDRR